MVQVKVIEDVVDSAKSTSKKSSNPPHLGMTERIENRTIRKILKLSGSQLTPKYLNAVVRYFMKNFFKLGCAVPKYC